MRADLSYPAVGLWSRNYSSELVLTQARLLGAHTSKSVIARGEEVSIPRLFSSLGWWTDSAAQRQT